MNRGIDEKMRDTKWTQFQQERGIGFAPIQDPTQMMIPQCSALRIRSEPNSRDFMNSRLWDSFRATPPTQVSSEMLQTKNGPTYMDMNPISSRTNTVKYRVQPEYMPDVEKPSEKNSTNPYLQRLDAQGADARNIARELRGAVTEDNRERERESNKKLIERQFVDRWLPQVAAADATSLQAYELLRPKQYDHTQ